MLDTPPVAPDSSAVDSSARDSSAVNSSAVDAGWTERTLGRFFGKKAQTGEDLEGTGQRIVDRYLPHAGKRIAVVIVQNVKSFEPGWDDNRFIAERLLNALSRPLHDYTREHIIRQYLLFDRGDAVQPFDLADSERMLRSLPFMHDAHLFLVPVAERADEVAIIVQTSDRWPFGTTMTIIDQRDWRAGVYTSNLLGYGVNFAHKILHREDRSPEWGYEGVLEKENLGGTFWGFHGKFEDSYRREQWRLSLERPLDHPGLNLIGGVTWEDLDDRDYEEEIQGYHQEDSWLGWVIRKYDHRDTRQSKRTILVPAARILIRDYYRRSQVGEDLNRQMHDRRQMMVSLAWLHGAAYRTSYLHADGEIENVNEGIGIKLTGALENGEYLDRPGLFLKTSMQGVGGYGEIAALDVDFGGFYRDGALEDGILDVRSEYASPLFGEGAYRHRFYSHVDCTLGFGRSQDDRIYLDERSGIEHLDRLRVFGTRRLVLRGRYRLFTPHTFMGFRVSYFGYGDVGFIIGPQEDLSKAKIRGSFGLGLRFRNPKLVLPTFQLHAFLVSKADGNDFRFGINLGNTEVGPLGTFEVAPEIPEFE